MAPTIIMTVIFILAFIAFILIYTENAQNRNREFKIKMEAAKVAKNSHILNMPYKDLLGIVDINMVYYVTETVLTSGLHEMKTDEERSLEFNDALLTVCTKVRLSLSDDLIQALLFYISEDHLNIYIKDSARILLVAKIENSTRQQIKP